VLEEGYVMIGDKAVQRDEEWSNDLLLIKVDLMGDTLWSRSYGYGGSNETGFSLQKTPDSGFILTGDGPEHGLWILKTDSQGDTLWSRLYQFGRVSLTDRGYAIEPTSDGGWIITGSVDYDVIQQGALCLLKINSAGDTLWTRIYNYGTKVDFGKSVKQTPDGGYIVLGTKNYSITGTGEIWLLKTDSLGDTLWTHTYGGNPQDRGDCIQLTSDGGYIITGYTSTYSSDGSKQVLLMKTDSLGLVEGIEEIPATQPVWQIIQSVGQQIVLRLESTSTESSTPRIVIYDALGRKVDEVSSAKSTDTIVWGVNQSPGVYFVVPYSESNLKAQKVVLIR
jgi:hypothetical protein